MNGLVPIGGLSNEERYGMFTEIWTDVGAKTDPRPTYEDMAESYTESHRHYHEINHPFYAAKELAPIKKNPWLLEHEDEVRAFLGKLSLADPDECLKAYVKDLTGEVGLSLMGHDKIYRISKFRLVKDNELRSAEWTRDVALAAGLSQELANNIYDNIIATDHTRTPQRLAAKLTIDCDLSILGKPAHVFDMYEQNIRKEWWFVPGPIFRNTRAKVLQKFLERDHIYETEYFRGLYEKSARENLQRSIDRLISKEDPED
jgi:predicted metal-dependent HD superfamily phosphohydrolase